MRWDAARRLLLAKETDADTTAVGAEVTYNSYDAAGRLRVTRSPAGVETWYDTDAAGRVVKITGPLPAPTRGCVALADNCAFPTTTPSGSRRCSSSLTDVSGKISRTYRPDRSGINLIGVSSRRRRAGRNRDAPGRKRQGHQLPDHSDDC